MFLLQQVNKGIDKNGALIDGTLSEIGIKAKVIYELACTSCN